MRVALIVLLFCSFQLLVSAQNQRKIEVSIDLINIKKDKVHVTVILPTLHQEKINWCFPAIVPGTYARYDFGRFIENLKAYDSNDNRLDIAQKGANEFIIIQADKLQRIEYYVNDTWDASQKDNYVFQPAGTYNDKGNAFVLNHYGYVGFVEGFENLPYEVILKKPYNLLSSSSLKMHHIDKGTDKEFAKSYFELADSPTLIGNADTLSFACSNSRIHVAVISDNKRINAAQMKTCLQPISQALAKFFQTLPVNDYHFLFYFADPFNEKISGNGASGALEHNYSSFYFLPAVNDTHSVNETVRDVTAHEFLHILTPLNIHSKEIERFNYQEPKMSKHLWMYEGVTEYFSHLIQLRGGMITEDEFMQTMQEKMENARDYPPFSFTEMSKNVCYDEYKDLYDNVYQKGALLGLLLDIELLTQTERNVGLPDVMKALAQKFGPSKPFNDDSLFTEIAALSQPAILDFFHRYIEGKEEPNYKEFYQRIGWTLHDSIADSVYSFGRFNLYYDSQKMYWLVSTSNNSNLFNLIDGDKITKINEVNVSENVSEIIEKLLRPKTDAKITLSIQRKKSNIELNARPQRIQKIIRNKLVKDERQDPTQVELRQKLFGLN